MNKLLLSIGEHQVIQFKVKIKNKTYLVNRTKIEELFKEKLTYKDIHELSKGIDEIKQRDGNIINYLYPVVVGLISTTVHQGYEQRI